MTDDCGIDGQFRNCLHSSSSWEFHAPRLTCYNYASHSGNAYAYEVETADVNVSLGLLPAPTGIDMNTLAAQAAAFMLPRVNEGTSLINFLIELKDVKRMVSPSQFKMRGNWTALRQMVDPRTRKQFIKEFANTMTGAHLNASFGLVPFVGDLVQMYNDLRDLSYSLAQLRKFAGIQQVRHYRRLLLVSGLPTVRERKTNIRMDTWETPWRADGAYIPTQRPQTRIVRWASWVQRPVYHATMRYRYTLPDMSEVEGKIASFLDVLGVRLDLSIVWNAIPYSFLVDWVVDVSTFLASFARNNFNIDTKVQDFCHSVAWSRQCGVDVVLTDRPKISVNFPESPNGQVGATVASNYTRYYNRVKVQPDLRAMNVRAPKLRQAALAGSLIINRNRRIHKWSRT